MRDIMLFRFLVWFLTQRWKSGNFKKRKPKKSFVLFWFLQRKLKKKNLFPTLWLITAFRYPQQNASETAISPRISHRREKAFLVVVRMRSHVWSYIGIFITGVLLECTLSAAVCRPAKTFYTALIRPWILSPLRLPSLILASPMAGARKRWS